MNNKSLTYDKIEGIVFFCSVLCTGLFFVFFYRRFLVYSYDIDLHRWFAELLFTMPLDEMTEISSTIPVLAITYPLFHISLKLVAFFTNGNYHLATYIVLALVDMISIYLFRNLFHKIYKPFKLCEKYLIDVFSLFAIIFVVAVGPLTRWRFYAVQCAANPVHNPTMLFVRPFGFMVIFAFAEVMFSFDAGTKYGRHVLLFGFASLVSVFAKPSFVFVFLPAMGIITLMQMIGKKTIKLGVYLFLAVIPTMMALLWQFTFMESDSLDFSMRFAIGGFTGLGVVDILLVSIATFPVVLILFSRKAFKENIYYKISILALFVGWLQMFLIDDGTPGNFSWGYDLAVQFATITSLAVSFKYNENRIRRIAGYVVFLYQAVCGIRYISLVFANFDFLI